MDFERMRALRAASHRIALAAFCCVAVAASAYANTYYVSTSGTAGGSGTYADPWDIGTAFTHEDVQPGDTIFLRGGTYGTGGSTTLNCTLDGKSGSPITIAGFPGERATFDGRLQALGGEASYIIFRDLEVMNSETDREIEWYDRVGGIIISGLGCSVYNTVIHDTGHPGIGGWAGCGESKVHGCLIWGTGYFDLTEGGRPEGSAIYAQNQTGTRYLTDNIVMRNMSFGIKPWSADGYVNGFHVEGNTIFGHSTDFMINGTAHPAEDGVFTENCVWAAPDYDQSYSLWIGIYNTQDSVEVTDNYMVFGARCGMYVTDVENFTFEDNTFVSTQKPILCYDAYDTTPTVSWDNNTYHTRALNQNFPKLNRFFREPGEGDYSFEEWQAEFGFDTNSTLTDSSPTSTVVFVRANEEQENRGNITIYNWPGDSTVDVDVSSVLTSGVAYVVRDAQNYYGDPVLSGTYTGGSITIPMDQDTVTQPIGDTPTSPGAQSYWSDFVALYEASAPYFGVFVVEQTSATVAIVEASDRMAYEHDEDDGEFTIRRTGDLGSALTVTYTVSGTATPSSDYTALSGTAIIAADSDCVTIPVEVLTDEETEGDETVTITLNTGSYQIHPSADHATVTISYIDASQYPLVFNAEDAVLTVADSEQEGWNVISDSDAYGGEAIQADVSLGSNNANGIASLAVAFGETGTYELYYRARCEDVDGDESLSNNKTFRISRGDLEDVFSATDYKQSSRPSTAEYDWYRASLAAMGSYFIYTVEQDELGDPQTCKMRTTGMGVTIDAIILSTDDSLTDVQLDALAEEYLE